MGKTPTPRLNGSLSKVKQDLAATSALNWPNSPVGHEGPPPTIANVRLLLDENGIAVQYDVIKKRTIMQVPALKGTGENADASAMTHILSLAAQHRMPLGLVPAVVEAIGDERSHNPAAQWVRSKRWDGKNRLPDIYETITPKEGYPISLRDTLIHRWLLSVAAAAITPTGFHCRGVLTLQGGQGIGKTKWGLSLIDDTALRDELVKVDHHLDAGSKDSVLGAVEHWIVEIGELESSFRRDVARLKGFLTAGRDKVRRPYARVSADYPRRTVFYATVNSADFLVDDTGNSRWWTIPVEAIDYEHGIDMQQLFAQLAAEVDEGEQWWLTPAEEQQLAAQNDRHRSVSVVREKLVEIVDPARRDTDSCAPFTASGLLEIAGFERPTNGQAKEAAALLRGWFGDPKRRQGRDKWRVPFRPEFEQANRYSIETNLPKKDKFD